MNERKAIANNEALNLFEYNIAGIYETGLEGEILTFNEAFVELMGYSASELNAMSGNALYYNASDRTTFVEEILRAGHIRNREVRYRRKDGSVAWCLESAFTTERDGNKVIIGTLVDITEQKLNADRFKSLFVASGDAIFIIEDGKTVQSNRRCCELFGYTTKELNSIDIFAEKQGLFYLAPSERKLVEQSISEAKEEVRRVCTLGQRKDQSQFHCELTITCFNIDGILHNQIIVRDISERVMHEGAMRESEARFKLLSEVAIEGIVFVVNDLVRDCNAQFVSLFGFNKTEELLGKNISDLIQETDLKRVMQHIDMQSVSRTEVRAQRKDGQLLILEATGSRIEYKHEDVYAFLFYNITSRKKTEQALEQSTERFKSLVEHSPNGIFILTEGRVRYVNQSGLNLLKHEEEDEIYDDAFIDFFHTEDQKVLRRDLIAVREGEEVEQKEFRLITSNNKQVVVGLVATLTVYDGQPSIQVTLNNLNTQMKLMQETLRAQIAEEINVVLKREIEKHKVTQRKLRQAENFTRNIIQSSLDMIMAQDSEGIITEFNQAAQKQFGYTSEQLIGISAEILFANPNDADYIRESIEKHGSFTGEVVNISRKGRKFTSYLSASVIRNDDGEIIGSMGVSRDITEVKKAERELRESEERYRDIFENATDFIFSVGLDGKFIYANRAFLETMAYTAEEVKELNLVNVVAGIKSVDGITERFTGRTQELEFRNKAGKTIKVFGDSSIKYNEGKPESIRAIFRDITDLRKHEQLATEQSAKLDSVFNSTENLMMWTMNLQGELTSFNNNFVRWLEHDFDYKPKVGDDIINRIAKGVNENAYQGQLQTFGEAFTGEPRQFEVPLMSAEGMAMWYQVFVNPVRIGNKMEEVSCLAYDITDRKEIDRKILASLKEKEVLLQEVHHRVKNNLQVISSILNLQSSFVTDENVLAILKESQSRIKTMSYIHETLYQTADFSSIEFTDYISSLARNLVQSYAPANAAVELIPIFDEIFLDLDQAIPCGLIINELVSNALKYAYQGREKGKLTIALTEEKGLVKMRIEDDGVGLPDDFKYENSESLGIYLVYALVEQLDAKIQVDSKRNKGTRFLITFEKQEQTS